jgi:hypothetical protein
VQDTGWSEHLPAGEGALAFTDMESAVRGVEAVAADYERHSAAAKKFAETYFDAAKVCGELIE